MMHILLVLLSYMLCLIYRQPGDPENKGMKEDGSELLYEDYSLEVECPSLFFRAVSAIPVSTGDHRIFTLDISTYAGKVAGTNVFSHFPIHCVMSGAPPVGGIRFSP